MTKDKLVKFDSTLIDMADERIEALKENHRELLEKLEKAEAVLSEAIAGYATGEATIANVKKAEATIEGFRKDIQREESAIPAMEKNRAITCDTLAPAIKKATNEAMDEAIAEYEAYFENVVQPTRIAYIQTVAELGHIKQKFSRIVAEHRENLQRAGQESDTIAKYGFGYSDIPVLKFHGSADFSGNPEEKALALSEVALSRVYSTGVLPKWAEVNTESKGGNE